MSELVVDASAAVTAVEGRTPAARELFERFRCSTLHAPHLIDAEVGHVLRCKVRRGELDVRHAAGALRALEHLVGNRYAHPSLTPAAWALRDNVTFYDALYVVLATRLGLTLVTTDIRLAHAPGVTCKVETVS